MWVAIILFTVEMLTSGSRGGEREYRIVVTAEVNLTANSFFTAMTAVDQGTKT